MVRFFHNYILQFPRKVGTIILALVLLSGFLLGAVCSFSADPSLLLLMRTAAQSRVSIVCLLGALFLPVICSALAVYSGHNRLIFPIAFAKSFFFGYLCSGILLYYPDSGPLFAVLLLFSDFVSLPVLCWIWFRSICRTEQGIHWSIPVLLFNLGIGFFDYQIVSPFLADLLS